MTLDSFYTFFGAHFSAGQLLLFAAIIIGLWFTEARFFDEKKSDKWRHTLTNAFLILTALPLQLAFNTALAWLTKLDASHRWGLVYKLPHPESFWVKYVLMFFVLDLMDYAYHWAMHKIPFLWRFHLVHHTDPKLDVSTTLREHPGETLSRNCFLAIGCLLCGVSFGALIARQTIQIFSNIIAHTSFRLTPPLARIVGWVFITPNLHHIHHHHLRPYTDSNYGDTFSLWDRLFGTLREHCNQEVVFGLDTYIKTNADSFHLFRLPFMKQASIIGTSKVSMKNWIGFGIVLLTSFTLCHPSAPSLADTVYPDYVREQCPVPLKEVGKGIYRRFGFRIYEATLWAADGNWNPQKPYLLELRYLRDVAKEDLVDGVIDDMRDQGAAGEETLAHWKQTFSAILPSVNKGDVLAGLYVPGQQTQLFLNGQKLATLGDFFLSRAFFNLWFSDQADKDLRESLLNPVRLQP